MDIKDIENQNQNEHHTNWRICCSHSSESFIKYIITVLFSLIVVAFSIYMITDNPERDNSIYFSLISSILTLYIPSPTLERLKELN
jgi:hypothetical protein